ncbi:hypothetical protein [Calothrix sp. 336/3]|nr:hypothetical protein [Calothrix sp. 336/3]
MVIIWELGLITQSEIAAWGDNLTTTNEQPADWMIELAVCENLHLGCS